MIFNTMGANARHKKPPNAVRCKENKKTEGRTSRPVMAVILESQGSLRVPQVPTQQRVGRQLRNSLWISAWTLRWHVGIITAPPDS